MPVVHSGADVRGPARCTVMWAAPRAGVSRLQCFFDARPAASDDAHSLTRHLLRNPQRFRFAAAGIAAVLAIAYLVLPDGLRERVDDTFLLLLAASAVIALVPWEHLASGAAGPFTFVLERPQVAGALRGLDTSRVEDRDVRRLLTELAPDVETIAGSRVLWIDDTPSEVLGERRLLRALGIEIVTARSSDEALAELARDSDFDVAITDVSRPPSSWEPRHWRPHPHPRPVRHVPALQLAPARARPLHDHRHARLSDQSGCPVMTASGVWPGMGSVASSK